MTSSFSTNKGFEEPASGDYINAWATPVNANWTAVDTALGGTTSISVTGVSAATTTLTLAQYRPPNIEFTGTLAANLNYQIPTGVGGTWSINNGTSGAFSLSFSIAAGNSLTLGAGRTLIISDGATVALANPTPLLYPQTAAESGLSIVPTVIGYPEGDMRRYGLTTGTAGPIQAANLVAYNSAVMVSAAGGSEARLPPGSWNFSAPPGTVSGAPITGDWSLRGAGRSSVIVLNGCNGITIGGQGAGAGGARFVRDLVIDGANATGNVGIFCDLDSVSGRVDGVTFDNVVIQNFSSPTGAAAIEGVTVTGLGLWSRGMWSCTFDHCWFINCYTSVYLYGLNTVPRFTDCEFILGPSLYNTVGTAGIICDIDTAVPPHRTEDLKLRGCHYFGYDKGLVIRQVLHLEVLDCDIDDCNTTCIELTQVLGTGSIRDNWMATQALTGAGSNGINLVNLGNNSVYDLIIDGNNIACNTASTASQAVVVGNFQSNTKVTNNTITGFQVGVSVGDADSCSITGNAILAIGNAIQITNLSTNIEIGPNNIQGGAPLVLLSGNIPVGLQYHARGTVLLTVTGITGSNTGTVNWFADGSRVTLYTSGITGTASGTTLTASGLATLAPFLIPLTPQYFDVNVTDNSITKFGKGLVDAAGGLTFYVGADVTGGAFTPSGPKGISATQMDWNYL